MFVEAEKTREGVPVVPNTQARDNSQRVLRGGQHDDLAIREEPEVPVIMTSALSCDIYTTHNQTTVIKGKKPPVVLNVVPSPVKSIQ